MEGVGTELEVPDHPDATIRLHKARIKSLSSEVGAAQTALKDKCVHPVAAHSFCLLFSHACHAILTLNIVIPKAVMYHKHSVRSKWLSQPADTSAGVQLSVLCVAANWSVDFPKHVQ